jgi:hypothetical protein
MNTYNEDKAPRREVLGASSEGNYNGSPQDVGERAAQAEELTYDPIPPKKTITVSVRYHVRGRGRPMPYPRAEKEGE